MSAQTKTNSTAGVTDPHREWLEEWRTLRTKVNRAEPESDEEARLFDELVAVDHKIMRTASSTSDGVLAQIEYALEEDLVGHVMGCGSDLVMFENIKAALVRGLV